MSSLLFFQQINFRKRAVKVPALKEEVNLIQTNSEWTYFVRYNKKASSV